MIEGVKGGVVIKKIDRSLWNLCLYRFEVVINADKCFSGVMFTVSGLMRISKVTRGQVGLTS